MVAYGGGCSTGWLITDNKIDGVTGTHKSGLQLFALKNATISNNQISNTTYGGMILDGVESMVVSGNTISNVPQQGIQVGYSSDPPGPSSNVSILNNTVTNANTLHKLDKGGICIYPGQSDILVVGNILIANYNGFIVRDKDGAVAPSIHVNFNNIYGNNGFGVGNFAQGGGMLDASLNWWGDNDGPSGEGTGAGDSVSTNVIFSPWLGIDPDGNPTLPGVQITAPMLIIVAPVGPEPTGGYLNAAIVGANSAYLPYADTIEVRHGTYDATEPITQPVNMASETGSALHTTLNGNMNINGNGVLIGLPLQGFRVNGNLAVGAGANAATSRVNWCDLYGNMTNNGTGTFDAQYNYWGTLLESVVDGRTTGDIDYEPFLPKNADDSYVDATAIIAAGLASDIDPAIDQLWLMVQLGQDVNTFIQYQGVAGAGAFAGAPVGGEINLGGAAGGGGAIAATLLGPYEIGELIQGSFTITDPVTGEPITDAAVTTSLLGPDGALVSWGCATYDETTGEYVFTIDTSGLAPGTYELIIQTDDGQSKTVSIE
ncbi:MAG: right-handed parallel beta-helix repeat-containing protein, partial [Chloroflexota bacterium]|nr:right-handed parallel beta-helix repeat-containing protein [Chloroflexota bacterium]